MVASEPFKCPYRCLERQPTTRYLPARKPRQTSALGVCGVILRHMLQNWFRPRPVNPSRVYGTLVSWPRGLSHD
jgi:hypothetical protein